MYMRHLFFFLATTLFCALPFADKAHALPDVASPSDRPITKEPTYQSTPKYSLIAIGAHGEAKVWMVEDGKRLFVDKNANGDLTDDGSPIQPSKVRNLDAKRWDFEYALDAIRPANGARHTNFVLRRWNYNDPQDSYGLSLSVDGQMPMYAGWFGTFWSTNRETAPVIHFAGPFKPTLLRRKEFVLGEKGERLSLGFFRAGSGPGAESRLSIDALPSFVIPKLNIEWPTANGGAPMKKSYDLTQRCCYWEFYITDFEMPRGVVAGKAKLTVELPVAASLVKLSTTEITAPVVGKLETKSGK
jgi:hypothetical protein